MSLDYKCLGCGRDFKSTLEKMIKRFRYGERKCLMCGGEVELPPEAAAAIAEIRAEHNEVDEITCACPCCLRETLKFRIDAREEPQTCRFCSHVFRPPAAEGGLTRGVATEGHLVTAEQVWERLPEDIGALVSVLAARAERGDLQEAELAWAAPRLEHVFSWRPQGATSLPLPPSELADAIPVLVYPGKRYTIHRRGRDREVVLTLKTYQRAEATQALNLVTDGALLMIGGPLAKGAFAAFQNMERKLENTCDRLRFVLRQSPQGARLVDVQVGGLENSSWTRAPMMGEALQQTFWEMSVAYEACMGAVCLLGRGVWGAGLVGLTTSAALRRLAELGLAGPHPDRLCPAVPAGLAESAGEVTIEPLPTSAPVPAAPAPAPAPAASPKASGRLLGGRKASAPAPPEAPPSEPPAPPKPAGRKIQPSGRLLGKRKPSP